MKQPFGFVLMELMVGGVGLVGCGGDSNSPTGPSEEITKWKKTFAEGQYTGHSVQQTVDGGYCHGLG